MEGARRRCPSVLHVGPIFPTAAHPPIEQTKNVCAQDGWDLDIQEDVEDECGKYGAVKHVYVDPKTPGGMVYALFAEEPVRE